MATPDNTIFADREHAARAGDWIETALEQIERAYGRIPMLHTLACAIAIRAQQDELDLYELGEWISAYVQRAKDEKARGTTNANDLGLN